MKPATKTKYLTGAVAVLGASSAAVAYAFLAPLIDTADPRRATLTLAGKMKLALLRALPNKAFMTLWNKGRKMPLKAVRAIEDHQIPTRYGSVPCTIYYPFAQTDKSLPVYVSLHGGGFVLRGIDQDDAPCRYIASEAACVVVNVDYSVAPEYPFPRPVNECFDVVEWIVQNSESLRVDGSRIAIGGYSAGGNLAAAVALMNLQGKAFSLRLQVVNYAPLDHVSLPQDKNQLSRKQLITPKDFNFFTAAYLPFVEQRSHPLASPALADRVQGLPPALLITAEYDLLKTDGERYVRQLRAGGVAVEYHEFKQVDHGFTHVGPSRQALAAWKLIAQSLKKAFA